MATEPFVNDNQEAALLKIAKDVLGVGCLELQGRDSLDFHTLSAVSIRAALKAAYEEGTRAAPAKRLQATIVASRFNTTITLYDALQGRVSVTLRDDNGEGAHYGIAVADITDVELMASRFEDEKVGVFQEVVKLLSAYHNGTISWDSN